MKKFKIITGVIFYFAFLSACSFGQESGIIKGKVIDNETQSPVIGAVVEVMNYKIKTESDEQGEFNFKNLAPGSYQIKVSAIGYDPVNKTDLVVYASKPLEIVVRMIPKGYITEEIDVNANFFQKSKEISTSSLNLDYEEIRRAPGAAEDISRMLQTAPGVSISNDSRNDIIIRGGSPAENLILIDGIEVKNINHFGTQGSTSGVMGFINSKLILETDLLTGGFPVMFGDKLSGVVDIKFREGSKTNYYGDINLSMTGFGGVFEGPFSNKSSFLLSVRRSYLELIKSSVRFSAVPNYWDFNLKTVHELSNNDKLIFVGFAGLDKVDFSGSKDDSPWGNAREDQRTIAAGLNYKKLFKSGYLQTVLSDSYSGFDVTQYYKKTDKLNYLSNSYENEMTLKSDLNYKLSNTLLLNTGAGGKLINLRTNLFLNGDTSYAGYIFNTIDSKVYYNTWKLFTHINLTQKLFNDRLSVNAGIRYDYFNFIRLKNYFSPRMGVSYKITEITSINAAYGIFYQSPEYLWLTSHPNNFNLNSIRSEHFILGLEHFFSSDIRATVEFYYKKYKDYPVWKDIPDYILIEGGSDFVPNLVGEAVSVGFGYVKGIDISIQKKLSGKNGLYGLINYSYSHSGFTALAGGERRGAFDPVHQVTLVVGCQFKENWLAGVKIKYNGGKPYTPIDENLSAIFDRGIYAANSFNSAEYPYYLRIDLRVDKKVNFKKIAIVGYIELQNLLNRANIYSYFWNQIKNAKGTIYQWEFLPVGGVSVQF